MDVYTNWCGPSKLLDKNTFQNPDVSRYISEHFYAVKFNAEGTEEITFIIKNLQTQITTLTEMEEMLLINLHNFLE